MMMTMPPQVPPGASLSLVTGTTINKNTLLAEPTLQQSSLYQIARERVTEAAPGYVDQAQEYLAQVGDTAGSVAAEVAVASAKSATNKALLGGAVVVAALFLLTR